VNKFALPALVILIFALFYYSLSSLPDAPEQAVVAPTEQAQTVPPVDNTRQDREQRLTEAVERIRAELNTLSDNTKANSDKIAQVAALRADAQDSRSSPDKTMTDQVDALRSDQTKFIQAVKEANDKAAQDQRQEIATLQTRLAAQFNDTLKAATARSEALSQRVDAVKTDLDEMKKALAEERQNASNISPGLALFVALAAFVLGPFVARQLTANQIAAARKQAEEEQRRSARQARAAESEPPLAPSMAASTEEAIHSGEAAPAGGETAQGDDAGAPRHAASDPEKV
jgi:uncharacterized phage infection (PIP) family protein YhgE